VREQYLMLRLDENRALAAIPKLLATDGTAPSAGLEVVWRTVASHGKPTDDAKQRFARVKALFEAVSAVGPRIGEARRAGETTPIDGEVHRDG
jgi:hypothetical protein